MALSGVHVAFGYVRETAGADPLFRDVLWSETDTTGFFGVTEAPATASLLGTPAFEVRASVDVWVAVGKSPDARSSPRRLVLAGEAAIFPCNEGDRLAWADA